MARVIAELNVTLENLDRVAQRSFAELGRACSEAGKLSAERLDAQQIVTFELTTALAELEAAKAAVAYALRLNDRLAASLSRLMVAEAVGRWEGALRRSYSDVQGGDAEALFAWLREPACAQVLASANAEAYATVAALVQGSPDGPARGLSADQAAIAATFRQFCRDVVEPRAEAIHRHDLLVPKEILSGLVELGVFGLSIPEAYGGWQPDDAPDNMGMILVTEELARGSLAAAGSLITRPEILAKALLKGGTPEQKRHWLPRLAKGESMAAVAVTEPDFGSDVAGIKLTARRSANGDAWILRGTKTWCTFAGYADTLMVLARTDPDEARKHRGLSLFIAEKPRFDGHDFAHTQPGGGRLTGRAIATLGYRGMHSYEVVFDDYRVPHENLIGGDAGLGQGFYLQMEGFAGGRLQTAARALGVMQAAWQAALAYAQDRRMFGKREVEFPLTQYKLARMLMQWFAARALTYQAARRMDAGGGERLAVGGGGGRSAEAAGSERSAGGGVDAALAKLFACRAAEYVTREAMQIHGGMGYAEEFAVSRYFVDARVLSIFEGAEEVLALRVIARHFLERALSKEQA